jgi:4-hydroxy-2-oxoheptanedioate aldolase
VLRSLEKAKKLKQRIYAGEPVLGTQLALLDPASMEIYGRAGFDWASVDTEHSAQTLVTVQSMIQAAHGWDIVPFVRPLIFNHDEIRRILDVGASGLLCPFIETAEQAQQLVDACRYNPRGKRGWNPLRATTFHIDDDEYMENYEDSLIILIIIESRIGAENAAEIMAVDGIDGVTVGGMDLSLDLGVFRQWDSPVYREAVEMIRAGAQAAGKAFGTGAYDMETARRSIANKETLLLSLGDVNVLAAGVTKLAADLRAGIASTQ